MKKKKKKCDVNRKNTEIQPQRKVRRMNILATIISIIIGLGTILNIFVIPPYDNGYLMYFGISNSLNYVNFIYLLVIVLTIIACLSFFGWILVAGYSDFKNGILSIIGCFIGCLILTFFLFQTYKLDYDIKFLFTVSFVECIAIIAFSFIFISFNKTKASKQLQKKIDYEKRNKFLNILEKPYFIIVFLTIGLGYISAFILKSIDPNNNMFYEAGFNFASEEATFKIATRDNKSYLLLENTDHQYFLMEIDSVSCEDTKVCYKGTRGKYQYIDDKTNLQIQETHCKIIFDE